MATNTRRPLDDKASFEALASLMVAADRAEYLSYGALVKEAAFPNRKFVIYTLREGGPSALEVVSCEVLHVDRDGPTVEVASGLHSQKVSTVPSRWRDRDLFVQVPQKFEIKTTGKPGLTGVQFVSLYALLFKMRSKPFHGIVGHTYAETLNDFNEKFPGVLKKY